MKKILLLFLIGYYSCIAISQETKHEIRTFSEETIFIHGLTEETGLRYVELILRDTNNIVIIEGLTFYSSKGIEKGFNDIFGWEEPACSTCNTLIKTFASTNRFFELPLINRYHFFDDYSLKQANQESFIRLEQKYQTDFSKKSISALSDSLKINFLSDLIDSYDLRAMDSLLLYNSFFNTRTDSDALKKVSGGKKVYYLRSMMEKDQEYLNQFLKFENGIFIIAKKGDYKIKGSDLKFRNNLKKKDDYTPLAFEELPSKVYIVKGFYLPKVFFKKNKSIYVSTLNECAR